MIFTIINGNLMMVIVIIILNHNNKDYVIDARFCISSTFTSSPLYRRSHLFSNGRISNSQTNDPKRYNTHFRNEKGANGESLNFLQSEPSDEWKIGYAFTLDSIDEKKVNNIQKVIVEHKESPF